MSLANVQPHSATNLRPLSVRSIQGVGPVTAEAFETKAVPASLLSTELPGCFGKMRSIRC